MNAAAETVDEFTIDWNNASRAHYVRLTKLADRSVLEQSWDFGETVIRHHRQLVDRAIVSAHGKPVALVQAVSGRLLPGLKLARITRGPVWLDNEPTPQSRAAVLQAIRKSFGFGRRRPLLWLPELPDGADSTIAMRGLGMRRMVTGYGSIWLDLRPGEDALRDGLDGKWRNVLNRAEREKVRIDRAAGGSALAELLAAYAGMRRGRQFGGASAGFVAALAEAARPNGDIVVIRALAQGKMVSGALFVRHGSSATYLVGWTGDQGREMGAGHLVLWRGLLALRQAKVVSLDLGGIDAGAPGIARFKLGLGGAPFTLAGTWL